jgi:hypothetical protein
MDNPTLKRSQVSLEFALAFIVILLLFIGGFKLWQDLNQRFIKDTTDYQAQRLASGSLEGDITIPQDPPSEVEKPGLPETDDPMLKKIIKIRLCTCIDEKLKKQAIDLYTKEYELDTKIQDYKDAIANLEEAKASMQDAYNQIPWCQCCCLCTIECYYCIYNPKTGSRDCGYSYTYETCCQGSLANQCASCPSRRWSCRRGYYARCISIRKNPNHEHTQYRQQIQDSIDNTQEEIDKNQTTLDGYIAEKQSVDSQLEAIAPEIACCWDGE